MHLVSLYGHILFKIVTQLMYFGGLLILKVGGVVVVLGGGSGWGNGWFWVVTV